jgi:peptidoglycan hydrolase-like protein with peptidoglycan-binding domain
VTPAVAIDIVDNGGASRRSPHRRRRRTLVAAVSVAAVFALFGASLALGPRLRTPQQVAAEAAPPAASVVTVAAQERVLTEPVVLRGKVLPGGSGKVLPPRSAVGPDSVVTKVLVGVGDKVAEGRILVVRSGSPLVALALPFPLYRDLVGGLTGPDVSELQKALRRLGYGAPRTGTLDSGTQQALVRFFRDRGFDAPTAQSVKADQPQPLAGTRPESEVGPALPRSSVVVLGHAGGTITAVHVKVGDVLASADAPLFELDGEAPFVAAAAGRDQASLITVGAKASISDDVTGTKVEAIVASVGGELPADGAAGLSGIAVRLTFVGPTLAPAQDRTVRVDLSAATDARPVLAVPVLALYSRTDATAFVTVVRANGTSADITVHTGRILGGWVEVTPDTAGALSPGDEVVVGRGS